MLATLLLGGLAIGTLTVVATAPPGPAPVILRGSRGRWQPLLELFRQFLGRRQPVVLG
jgi:hypothetical protein